EEGDRRWRRRRRRRRALPVHGRDAARRRSISRPPGRGGKAMSLIKLTGVPHPDLSAGVAHPVYIDASRVLLICPSHVEHPKLDAVNRRKEVISQIWAAAEALHEKV